MVEEYPGHGDVRLENRCILMERGPTLTGISWGREFPSEGYEVIIDARRIAGQEEFLYVTFPVGGEHCALLTGALRGEATGLANVDGQDARAGGMIGKGVRIESGRQHRVRLRVTEAKVEAWFNQEKVVDLPLAGHRFTCREVGPAAPFGISAWQAKVAIRNIQMRRVGGE